MHAHASRFQYLRNEQSQFAIAKNGKVGAFRNPDLIKDLASSRKRLNEYRLFRRYRVRNNVKIRFGQGQKLSECAGVANDTQHCTLGAVPAKSSPAPLTTAARKVDFTCDTPADKPGGIRLHDLADKFMPRCSPETIVAVLQFDIGVTDSSAQKPDQSKARRPSWFPKISDSHSTVFQVDRKHARNYTTEWQRHCCSFGSD